MTPLKLVEDHSYGDRTKSQGEENKMAAFVRFITLLFMRSSFFRVT